MPQGTKPEAYYNEDHMKFILEIILPHHAFYRARGFVIVLCVTFRIVHGFDISFNHKIY